VHYSYLRCTPHRFFMMQQLLQILFPENLDTNHRQLLQNFVELVRARLRCRCCNGRRSREMPVRVSHRAREHVFFRGWCLLQRSVHRAALFSARRRALTPRQCCTHPMHSVRGGGGNLKPLRIALKKRTSFF